MKLVQQQQKVQYTYIVEYRVDFIQSAPQYFAHTEGKIVAPQDKATKYTLDNIKITWVFTKQTSFKYLIIMPIRM